VVVPAGMTVAFDPGRRVEMRYRASWDVSGELLAVGTPSQRITFTAVDTTQAWDNLYFLNGSRGTLEDCDIEYGGWNGIWQVQAVNPQNLLLDGCTVRHGMGDGLYGSLGNQDTLTVINCTISDNTEDGVYLTRLDTSVITVSGNTVTGNGGNAYSLGPGVYPSGGAIVGNGYDGLVLSGGTVYESGSYEYDVRVNSSSSVVVPACTA